MALVRRLLSPTGFVLVALCFLLPFLTLSCGPVDPAGEVVPTATYTGLDLVTGGKAAILVPVYDDASGYGLERLDDFEVMNSGPQKPIQAQPSAVVALVLILAGAVSAVLGPTRLRAVAAASAALAAALALLAAELRGRLAVAELLAPLSSDWEPPPPSVVQISYGFWLAMGLLIVIGFVNVAVAVPASARVREVMGST